MVEIDGAKVRAARLALSLSQEEFADRLGVSSKSVFKWESGKGIRFSNLRQLAALTGKHPSHFYKDPPSDSWPPLA